MSNSFAPKLRSMTDTELKVEFLKMVQIGDRLRAGTLHLPIQQVNTYMIRRSMYADEVKRRVHDRLNQKRTQRMMQRLEGIKKVSQCG